MLEEYRARDFAVHWHAGQTRKYTGEPYWHHLRAVAELVKTVPHTDSMVCAAWLHDVLEDTDCSRYQIMLSFGEDVAQLVECLTDVFTKKDWPLLNRKERKKAECARLALTESRVQTIKLADLLDNTASIMRHDPQFATVYLEEKKALVRVLKLGDPTLWELANSGLHRPY